MEAVQICSIAPEEIKLPMRTYKPSGYTIPACPADKPFTSVVLTDMQDEKKIYMEYDWTKAEVIPIPIPVSQIVADFFANEKLAQRGCFTIPADAIPSEQQIVAAKEARKNWLQLLVQEGDKEFLRSHRIDQIPDFCKRAVKELGVLRDWAFLAPQPLDECPACGESIKFGVAVCKSCHAILDPVKAKSFGLGDEEPQPAPARRGRPPKAKDEEEIGGI